MNPSEAALPLDSSDRRSKLEIVLSEGMTKMEALRLDMESSRSRLLAMSDEDFDAEAGKIFKKFW